ncbi:MAG: Nif3-like dinuclear metal center hexameric protein [Sporomusaceae bacterium]|nr:Nif3-like dinuclear metal center hexameric protein [Sporomusaceae bacterium]
MTVTCASVMQAMENWAPAYLAEEWDKIGLFVGAKEQPVNKIMTTLDVTLAVAQEAAEWGADLIVSHHPFLFKPLSKIDTNSEQGKIVKLLLTHDIAVFSAHTNLDCARGGVNDVLAQQLGLRNIRPFISGYEQPFIKLVTYVPQEAFGAVWQAVTSAGAGHIGQYSHCTFAVEGTGSFLPQAGTSPYLGKVGSVEKVSELRLETILPAAKKQLVLEALLSAHPYEEVAYDLYSLENKEKFPGLGRLGTCSSQSIADFAALVKTKLGLSSIQVSEGDEGLVETVAVVGGSGAEFFRQAKALGAQVLVTGDVKYHDAVDAKALGITLIDAGHYGTEAPVVPVIAEYLQSCFSQIIVTTASCQKSPFSVY